MDDGVIDSCAAAASTLPLIVVNASHVMSVNGKNGIGSAARSP
jgi:hypothetical protein